MSAASSPTTIAPSNLDGRRSLVDSFGRRVTYLRLSVTNRCNFRCVYCMPADGVPLEPATELLSFEEIARVVTVMASMGVGRIRLTGGEPLVRRDLATLVRMLRAIDGVKEVVLTTNGLLLGRQAVALLEAGLAGLTVSVDSLRADRFARITRGGELDRVLEGIEAARRAGFGPIKINTVLIRGFNDDEVLDLVDWALSSGHVLRFIEFMPIGEDTIWGLGDTDGSRCVPAAELRQVLERRYALSTLPPAEGVGPARYLRLSGPAVPEGVDGRVGVISAVTECFCAGCNRIRMTPQGGLRACLADDREVDLRAVLRSGGDRQALEAALSRALFGKQETHTFDIEGGNVTLKQMVSIGG